MGHFTAMRDKAGALIGFTERGDAEPLFTQTLRDTMVAVGATEQPEGDETQRPRYRPGRREAVALVGGLMLAVAAIAALNAFTPAPAPRSVPTPAPAATSAPTATRTPTQAPTATPEPPTATSEPPPPTPEVVYIEVPPACEPAVNPRFAVEIDLSPIGRVRGVSCTSQEEAQANADRLAAEMRAAAEER
jgi:hypothetical protein